MGYKTIVEDNIDVLVAGAGLGGTGAAFEASIYCKSRNENLIEGSTNRQERFVLP